MDDDSLKRKLYEESPSSKLHRSPMMNAAMVNIHRAKTELKHNPKLRNDLKVGSIGLLVGIILGGLLANAGNNEGGSRFPLLKSLGGNTAALNGMKGHGWNPIHVFYGKMTHVYDQIPEKWFLAKDPKHNTPNSKEWFAQHGQDVAVAKFFDFKRNGFFVDLASNDAVWASNTFSLEQNFGWKGICIEANPVYWYRLSFRTNCHVVGSVVGGKDFDQIKVSLPSDPKVGGPFGGIVGKEFDNKKGKDTDEKRYTASLVTILDRFDAPKMIDYLSLDVEGAEEFIIKDFPFHKPYTFKLISIERPSDALKKKLQHVGYKHVLDFKRGDTLWAHTSMFKVGKKRLETKPHEIEKHMLDAWPPTKPH